MQSTMQVNDNRDALKSQSEALAGTATAASEALRLVGDAFAQQAGGVDDTVDRVSERLRALIELLRTQSSDVAAASDLANRQVEDFGQTLAAKVSLLGDTADTTRETLEDMSKRVHTSAKVMMAASAKASQQAGESVGEFERQAKRLAKRASEVASEAKALKEDGHSTRRDLFMKSARFIVEDLNSISIDLSRVLENDVPETDWKRYVKGDRSVFTRNLLRKQDAAMLKRISERVRDDKEARGYVFRYLEQFERLLEECRGADPENLMHSTFTTADVGKLYILLNRALGRDD